VSSEGHHGPTAVVVVNYRAHQLLERNLAPLQLGPDFTVVVVDNYSSATEAAAAEALAKRSGWEFVARADNRGFAAGVSAGLQHACAQGCESFVLLNPDVVIAADTLHELRAQVTEAPDTVVSPLVATPTRRPRGFPVVDLRHGGIRSEHAARRRGDSARVERWLPATCLALHRSLLERIGELDETYFMYWEDLDLCRRCVVAGGRLVLRDDLEVLHDELGTQRTGGVAAKSALYYRYNARNRLIFAVRQLDTRSVLRWIAWTPVISWRILLQGGRRQLLHSAQPLLAIVRGSVEGVAFALSGLVRRRVRR
jgi:N-acetylglucosaminyl-diphospho-decaprenol L-rhamnosyltransferase